MAEINWGLIDPNTPAKIAGSFYEGQQQRQANALQAQQLEHAQTANMLGKYQLGQAKRADEQQNALADVYRTAVNPQTGAIDSNALMQGLAQRGLGAKIPEVQKNLMEAQKAKIGQALEATKLAKVGATQVMANPNLSTAMTVLQQLQTQTGMDQSAEIARLQAIGDNPEAIKQWAAGHALEADKLLPKLETLNLGGVERLQQRDPLTGQVIGKPTDIGKTATPGEIMSNRIAAGNLGLSQQRFAWEKDKPIFNESAGGFVHPPNDKNPQDGIIPVAGIEPKLTEVQAKGYGFATRANDASRIIENIGEKGAIQPGLIKRSLEAVPFAGEGLGTMANVTQSATQQQVEQAQRDFVNAILRQESGAAIGQSEFDNAKKQYFPQPGDSEKVIQQKRQNRETSIRALEVQAGPAMKKPSTATGPKIGEVMDGYVYQGGDPAKQSSWKKQK